MWQPPNKANIKTVTATGNSVASLCRFGSTTSMSNISQTITNFEKWRYFFVIWNVMIKNLHFSKIPSKLFTIKILS
jgi:hypothetical protein